MVGVGTHRPAGFCHLQAAIRHREAGGAKVKLASKPVMSPEVARVVACLVSTPSVL